MLRIINFISRVIVGATFVFSGFVKAVDPVGGAVKFTDYFQAFGLEWLSGLALPLAIALAALEFLMGTLLLFNAFPKIAAKVAFIFMAFFTLLALGLAIFNPVSDCGCFGDAILLTNWQTFFKNLVLMIPATLLIIKSVELPSPYPGSRQAAFAFLMLIYLTVVAFYSLQHLPIIDFRPYAIGRHIPSAMTIPDGAEEPEYETTFILEKNGEQKTFSVDDYPYDDTTWVFVNNETTLIKEGYQPPVHDFMLQHPTHGNITESLMQHEGPLFLLISPDVTGINNKTALEMAAIASKAEELNYLFYCVTASLPQQTKEFNQAHKTNFSFLEGDETNLKTIIRSNPGLLLLHKGTVAGKWHHHDFPSPQELENPLSTALTQNQAHKTSLLIWGHLFLIALLAVFVLKSSRSLGIS